MKRSLGKDGRRYNPDRTKWKLAMARRRERLAKLNTGLSSYVRVCRAIDLSTLNA